jgi:hypothetical protein
MTDDQKLDDLFRERLEQYSLEPPPGVWQGILRELEQKKPSRRIVFLRWSAVAALFLLAITTGVLVFDKQSPEILPKPSGNISSQSTVASGEKSKDQPVKDRVSLKNKDKTAKNQKSSAASTITTASGESAVITANNIRTTEPEQMVNLTPLKKIEAILKTTSCEKLIHSSSGMSGLLISVNSKKDHNRDVAIRAGTREKDQRMKKGWSVGLQVSPAYSSFASSYTDEYARKLNRTGGEAQASIGGGISVHYIASPRWHIESGIQYSQSSDKPGSSHLFSDKADYAATQESGYKFYNSTLYADNGQLSINSTAGVIQFGKTPVNAELVTWPESAMGLNTALLTSGELSQVFDFIEFPMKIHYHILNKKPVIDLFSGVSTNFLVGNNVIIRNQTGNERVGKTKDISTVTLSGVAGIGFIFPISKRLSFSLEPQTNFSIYSINHSRDVEYRPWRAGIYSGLSYNF